jgi:translation initiation factor 1 (eIF-1/SUI1)
LTSRILNFKNPIDLLNELDNTLNHSNLPNFDGDTDTNYDDEDQNTNQQQLIPPNKNNIIENDPIYLFTGKNGKRTITKIIGISNYISILQSIPIFSNIFPSQKILNSLSQLFKKTLHCNVFIDKDNNINLQGNHIIEISKFFHDNNINNFIIKGIL